MKSIDLSLLWPLIALQGLLAVIGLVSLVKAQSVRGPKWMWAIIILLGNLLGSLAYFTIGRKE
ncbi:PLDc_N domain-containing protein [Paenibacillus sp. 7124]|uniref:PLDc_N domain-containing protein n=1 Tax=Paenibacillus apii TaxID=1850370 RepID=A0A6M1PY41_9BACL|nr:PLD nuclease N-terminal domain-containing protein [Paenibacillus apii]NGM85121.1 PLDc_N domain-containing protein [Paenibacillus apii]NJJ42233.1 PLDc_N domain-containing protein [Paenibacillus apii]